ncbi:MAG: metallophosphoesterase [Oscillospiraceae bacterium]|nr:metallophosphoesterase [Oscillospiraceae bacterium]
MSLFVMGDTHLSIGVPEKSMEIFSGWENYQSRIEQNWKQIVQPEDTVVLAGDISWGMSLEQAKPDFALLDSLPGQKIILKGNHDYWWNSMKKMTDFFEANQFRTLHILHNNCYAYENIAVCGTRGWVNMPGESADAKVLAREQQRLRVSLQAARNQNLTPVAFLHYPPIFANSRNELMLEVLHEFEVKDCYYGHLHGKIHNKAVKGLKEGICYHLIAGDYLQFIPEKIL